jgi:hypothetical protein
MSALSRVTEREVVADETVTNPPRAGRRRVERLATRYRAIGLAVLDFTVFVVKCQPPLPTVPIAADADRSGQEIAQIPSKAPASQF